MTINIAHKGCTDKNKVFNNLKLADSYLTIFEKCKDKKYVYIKQNPDKNDLENKFVYTCSNKLSDVSTNKCGPDAMGYNIPSDNFIVYENTSINKNNKPIGYLNTKFEKIKEFDNDFLPLAPKSYYLPVGFAQKIAKERSHDIILHNGKTGYGASGSLTKEMLNKNIDFDDPSKLSQLNSKLFNPNFITPDQSSLNATAVYLNHSNIGNSLKNHVSVSLAQKIKQLEQNHISNTDALSKTQYRQAILNNTNKYSSYDDYKNANNIKQLHNTKKKSVDSQSNQLSAGHTTEASNAHALGTLKELQYNKQQNIETNYKNLNKIDESILTTSEKINKLKDRHKFNNNIIKQLRLALLIIFLLMMCVFGYYGVRDKYIQTSKKKT